MTKKLLLLVFCVFLSLVAFKSLLVPGFPYTHDGENHLARFANYKIALKEGQFPPRFAPNLMNHYGYPVLNYNYPLANIISIPFSVLKVDYGFTFKFMVFSFVAFGVFGVYKYLGLLGFSKKAKIYSALVFISTPYLVSSVIYRGNIGEITAINIFAWLLWITEKLRREQSLKLTLLAVVLYVGFLLSHNISVLVGIPLIIIYSLFRLNNKRSRINYLFILLTSLLLSFWFWLPAYFEKGFVIVGNTSNQHQYISHFVTLKQLIISKLQFGFSYSGAVDSLSFSIGWPLVITIILFFGFILNLIVKSKFSNKEIKIKLPGIIVVSAVMSLLLIIFQLKLTLPLWKIIPFTNYIQFPWRLSLFLMVFSLPLVAYVFEALSAKLKMLMFIVVLIIFIKSSDLSPVDRFYKNNIDIDAFSQSTSTQNENLPTTFSYLDISDWKPGPSIVEGEGSIDVELWSGSKRHYLLDLKQDSLIIEPTMYFKGWETTANNQKISYQLDGVSQGRIAYLLGPGSYDINTKFTQNTVARVIGNWTSLITAICFGLYFFINKNLKTKK